MNLNFINKLSKRERTILYAVIAVISCALLYMLAVEPFIKSYKKIDNEIKLTKIKLQRYLSVAKDKARIEEEYADFEKKLKYKDSDEQELTLLLNELETIASSSGVRITNMRPGAGVQKDFYKRFTVDIETESDMQALMRFIYNLKNSKMMLKVERLSLNTRSSQGGTVIRASMSISKIAVL